MVSLIAALFTLIALSSCHSLSSFSSYSSYNNRDSGRDNSRDSYGYYYYDSLGYRKYTSCIDSSTRTSDQCRDIYSRRDYGHNSYARNDWNRNYDYDRDYNRETSGRVNVGRGSYRITNGGRDAELTCEFPRGNHLISNIVWEKVRDRNSYSRYNDLRDALGRRMEVERIGNHGSNLIIQDYEDRDDGIYRCVGTRTYDNYYRHSSAYDRTETVYMEIQFYPSESYSRGYSGYFNSNRNYYPSNGYRSSYNGYRTSGVSTSEDTIVSVDKDQETKEVDKRE